MPDKLLCVSEGKLVLINNKQDKPVICQSIEKYKQNVHEIEKRKEWKTKNSPSPFGGIFMGSMPNQEAAAIVSGARPYDNSKMIYSFVCAERSGFYIADIDNQNEPEQHVISKNELKIRSFDFNKNTGEIIASIKNDMYTYSLAVFNVNNTDFHILTEGDCQDANPCFSKTERNTVYYDSGGLGLDKDGNFVELGNRTICRLNYKSGDIDEIVADDKFDFLKPVTDENGNLYYIKKPHESGNKNNVSLSDFVLMPFKILKAIFGWLDFFTKRYAGETLKTSGANPAQMKEKTEEELFIEGNLINVEKTLRENSAKDGQYAGIVPRSWELIKRSAGGTTQVLKKGVLDYTVSENNEIFYSNGKFIKKITLNGSDEIVCRANMAVRLAVYGADK